MGLACLFSRLPMAAALRDFAGVSMTGAGLKPPPLIAYAGFAVSLFIIFASRRGEAHRPPTFRRCRHELESMLTILAAARCSSSPRYSARQFQRYFDASRQMPRGRLIPVSPRRLSMTRRRRPGFDHSGDGSRAFQADMPGRYSIGRLRALLTRAFYRSMMPYSWLAGRYR